MDKKKAYKGNKKLFINNRRKVQKVIQVQVRGILADHFSTYSPNLLRHLSERRTNSFHPAWQKSRPCPLNQFSAAVFASLSEENLVPDKEPLVFSSRRVNLKTLMLSDSSGSILVALGISLDGPKSVVDENVVSCAVEGYV
ncbi:hypothetical protein AVEN_240487-1 [Araneus ventricosus]|uniref:Uncharacterized protein n=1 Tax=Araneus ventricosus TaxID=182803 RepID=A0A4Y2HLX6_ARAVE|nr:hypothetical protein AVEN_240487-1 [Araneus ventricosus]